MVSCRNCKFYYVTWDNKFPHGCKALGFKSPRLPSIEVYESSRLECLQFSAKHPDSNTKKNPKKGNSGNIDGYA